MVNFLEGLYALAAVTLAAAVVQFARGRPLSSRRFAVVAATGGVLAAALYWYLG
ncbi:MAG: hypothetical protein ACT4QD_18525 [Acidobacteriota bacterium]